MTKDDKNSYQIVYFQEIINHIREGKRYGISVNDIEYYIKSNLQCVIYPNLTDKFISYYQKRVEKLQTENFSKTIFDKIFSQMFPDEIKSSLCLEVNRVLQTWIKSMIFWS